MWQLLLTVFANSKSQQYAPTVLNNDDGRKKRCNLHKSATGRVGGVQPGKQMRETFYCKLGTTEQVDEDSRIGIKGRNKEMTKKTHQQMLSRGEC